MRGLAHYQLPDLKTCIEANMTAARLTNPKVKFVGVSFNTKNLSKADAERALKSAEDLLGVPAVDPLTTGVGKIADQLW
jgi:uncharacterized NAD-dependent epimerase/dehydratase family protein